MARNTPTTRRSVFRPSLTAALGLAALVTMLTGLTGCRLAEPQFSWHGNTPIPSGYEMGWRQGAVSGDVSSTAVAAAAEAALDRSGYTIISTKYTRTTSEVKAATPGEVQLGRIIVKSRVERGRTLINVWVGPVGDEERSAIILTDVITLLGF